MRTLPKPTLVIVLGPYRSGTSITARMVASFRVKFGDKDDLIPADSRNPSGYFERDDINRINHRLIESCGGTLDNPGHPAEILAKANRKILQDLSLSWMKGRSMVGIKDPRHCATLALWSAAGVFDPFDLKVIHISRNTEDTLSSCLKHGEVASYGRGDPERLREMITTYKAAAEWQIDQLTSPHITMAYEDMMAFPTESARRIANLLGVSSNRLMAKAASQIGREGAQIRLKRQLWWRDLRFRLGGIKSRLTGSK